MGRAAKDWQGRMAIGRKTGKSMRKNEVLFPSRKACCRQESRPSTTTPGKGHGKKNKNDTELSLYPHPILQPFFEQSKDLTQPLQLALDGRYTIDILSKRMIIKWMPHGAKF